MLKNHFYILFIFLWFAVPVQEGYCQTTIRGHVLSVDGSKIPKSAISVRPEIQKGIFSGHFDDIYPAEDGSYQFQINEPGLYRIIFRGVFHQGISLPVMVYNQPSMTMNVLLMPRYFNDGFYFTQDDYTNWIRVYGNFNDYNYNAGKQFSLNPDESISAYVPVTSDTLRYQIGGLTYGRGSSVLPQADEFQLRADGSFEAVLYKNLPQDSLEIRYEPGKTIPFTLQFPMGVEPQQINLSGFISLKNQGNENWIRPLDLLEPYRREFNFVAWEMSKGIPVESQIELQSEYTGDLFFSDLSKELEQISTDLHKENLHPQQRALLTMSYASTLGWMARKTLFQQMRKEHSMLREDQSEEIPKTEHDSEILRSIPEMVPPVHPAWKYNNGAADYLLTESGETQKFIEYFHDVVQFHPDDRAVQLIALTMIRQLGSEYSSVEEMPVYHLIVKRYGERELAQDAHRAFSSHIKK